MHDPEYLKMTEEYQSNSLCWSTDSVLLLDQILTALEDSSDEKNSKEISEQLASTPWLREASSDARKSHLENTAKARLQHKVQQPAAPKAAAAAEAHRAKMK